MEISDNYRQHIKDQYPEEYRQLLKIEQANEDAMQQPKDEMTLRLEALGFRRGAVCALSNMYHFCTPCDKNGEYNLVLQKGQDIYNRYGELSIRYESGVDVCKPCGRILMEGFYTIDEFTLLLEKMERSHWYREKKNKKRLPVLSILQREVYDALPLIFPWTQGKEIASNTGMPSRTAQRFFGNQSLFHKVKSGTYTKKIIFAEM